MTTETTRVEQTELLQFIERYERLEAEKKDIADLQKEVMAELKGRGYDAAPFREVLRIRRMDPEKRAEFEAVLDLYREAVGV